MFYKKIEIDGKVHRLVPGVDLQDVDLAGMDLRRIDLSDSDLSGGDFQEANLKGRSSAPHNSKT